MYYPIVISMEEMDKDQEIGWKAFADDVHDVADAARQGDTEGLGAATSAMTQQASQLDPQVFLNSLHVPEDAGQYEEGLRKILARIPDGWGRFISCSAGWYPIIVELDEKIAEVYPDYEVHQVKEKYGTLRYYYGFPEREVPEVGPRPDYPKGGGEEEKKVWSEANKKWRQKLDEYYETPEGKARAEKAEQDGEKIEAYVRQAEAKAARTCEICGQPGVKTATMAPSPWYQTLCETHAQERGSIPADQWDEWWEDEKPRFEARQRARFYQEHNGEAALVISEDKSVQVSIDAIYLDDVEAAKEAASHFTDYKHVWLGDGQASQAYVEALRTYYDDHAEKLKQEKAAKEAEGDKYFYAKSPEGAPYVYSLGKGMAEPSYNSLLQEIGVRRYYTREEHLAGNMSAE